MLLYRYFTKTKADSLEPKLRCRAAGIIIDTSGKKKPELIMSQRKKT